MNSWVRPFVPQTFRGPVFNPAPQFVPRFSQGNFAPQAFPTLQQGSFAPQSFSPGPSNAQGQGEWVEGGLWRGPNGRLYDKPSTFALEQQQQGVSQGAGQPAFPSAGVSQGQGRWIANGLWEGPDQKLYDSPATYDLVHSQQGAAQSISNHEPGDSGDFSQRPVNFAPRNPAQDPPRLQSDLARAKEPSQAQEPSLKSPFQNAPSSQPSGEGGQFGFEIDFEKTGRANVCMGAFVSKHRVKDKGNLCLLDIATAGHCALPENWNSMEIKAFGLGRYAKQATIVEMNPSYKEIDGKLAQGDSALVRINAPCDKVPNNKILPLAEVDESGDVVLDEDKFAYQQKRINPVEVNGEVVNEGGGGLVAGELGTGRVVVSKKGQKSGSIYDKEEAAKLNPNEYDSYEIPDKGNNHWQFLVHDEINKRSQGGDSGAPIVNAKGELLGVVSGGNGVGDDFSFDRSFVGFVRSRQESWYKSENRALGSEFAANWKPPRVSEKLVDFSRQLASK